MNRPLRIAFGHYGIGAKDGVNTVMARNIRGLATYGDGDMRFTLFGRAAAGIGDYLDMLGGTRPDYVDIPGFDHACNDRDVSRQSGADYIREGTALAAVMAESLEPHDLVCFENTTVGNHPAVSYAVHAYARACLERAPHKRFLVRAHDFLLDRPANLANARKFDAVLPPGSSGWRDVYFPRLPNLAYIGLTTGACATLAAQGIDPRACHYLPNSIDDRLVMPDDRCWELRSALAGLGVPPAARVVYYPVRCVPRKNVEEAVLLMLLLGQVDRAGAGAAGGVPYHLIISMDSPEPRTAPYARMIKDWVRQEGVPVTVGFGSLLSLERVIRPDGTIREFGVSDAYAIADLVVTTSLLEGFGLAYTEPWALGRLVIGRNLPAVTRDLVADDGLDLTHLYDRLETGTGDFADFGRETVGPGLAGNAPDPGALGRRFEFILRCRDSAQAMDALVDRNRAALGALAAAMAPARRQQLLTRNREVVARRYSQAVISRRFAAIIASVCGAP
jgi:glycosyltransferase involved in cell wall biosynthesis